MRSGQVTSGNRAPGTGPGPATAPASDHAARTLLATGQQDTNTAGLAMPEGVAFAGTTSDHLVTRMSGVPASVGSEMRFQPDYSALMRAMSAPDVAKVLYNG
ncbi:hypothetical protein [Minwuia sp.]|uniref:hypothetical protein n=1 Tax=Minwuia sp. TaxID=2493630 RepID=UPI003A8F68F9